MLCLLMRRSYLIICVHTSDVSLSHLNRPARSCLSTISSLSSAHLSSNTWKYFGLENICNFDKPPVFLWSRQTPAWWSQRRSEEGWDAGRDLDGQPLCRHSSVTRWSSSYSQNFPGPSLTASFLDFRYNLLFTYSKRWAWKPPILLP